MRRALPLHASCIRQEKEVGDEIYEMSGSFSQVTF